MNGNNAPRNVTSPGKPRRMTAKDWAAFVVCLICAFGFWLYVMHIDNPQAEETILGVEVELINTSALEGERGLSVYSGYGNTVDVTVIGKRSTLNKLTPSDIKATADVSLVTRAGDTQLPIRVELPSGLTLSGVSQNQLGVYCDERTSRTVSVRARVASFRMESVLEMGELSVDHETITVSGPREALEEIDYALVSLDLGAITSSITASGKITLVDASGARIENPFLKLSRSDVTVTVPVYMYKTIPLKVAYKYGYFNDGNVRITLNPSVLNVRGDPSVLEGFSELTVATLDEKKIAGDVTQKFGLELPEGVSAADNIDSVTVAVTQIGTRTSTFTVTNINETGAVGLNYEIVDVSLSVVVRGTLEQLGRLKASDFSALLDLSGYKAGTTGSVRIPVRISIDSVYAEGVYEIGDYSVLVKFNG